MRTSYCFITACVIALNLIGMTRDCCAADGKCDTPRLKDCLWVWGNPEMTTAGKHTIATFAQASPAERAKLLGTPNVMMGGHGLPNDDAEAELLTKQVAHCPRILWEISADGESDAKTPFIYKTFIYKNRIAQVRRLAKRYPQIEGVVLDDMSSRGLDNGFKAEHIARIRELLGETNKQVKIWGVVYTMNLDRPGMTECIKELDVILLCEWSSQKVGDIEKHVAYCERLFPGKKIVLCTYLYDYDVVKRMSRESIELQYDIALKLFRAGRIEEIVIVTIDNDAEAVAWTADWIKRMGDVPKGIIQAGPN